MGFGKFLLGGLCTVGAIVAAPVVLPAAAAVAGTAAAAAGTAVAGSAVGTAVTGAVTAAGTAVAGTAVGGAAVGAMSAVGGAVGTAAGAVGLSSVATVAGTSAGAAAVGTIATSTVVGAAGAVSGVGKMKEASQTKEMAEHKYKAARKEFDVVEKKVTDELENLGELKLNIWNDLNRFVEAVKKLKAIEELRELGLDEMLHFEKGELDNINVLGLQAKEILQGGATSIVGGKLIGIATSAGISGAASSIGIAGLHGAAAANASLAALGGGSLASGGLGMAGGAVVSQGLVFAPTLAISGMFLHSKGKAKLEAAKETKEEVDKLTVQLGEAKQELCKLENLSVRMRHELYKYRELYDNWVARLEGFVEKFVKKVEKHKLSKEEKERLFTTAEVFTTGMLASILKDLASTKLLVEIDGDKMPKVDEKKINEKIEGCSKRWNDVSWS